MALANSCSSELSLSPFSSSSWSWGKNKRTEFSIQHIKMSHYNWHPRPSEGRAAQGEGWSQDLDRSNVIAICTKLGEIKIQIRNNYLDVESQVQMVLTKILTFWEQPLLIKAVCKFCFPYIFSLIARMAFTFVLGDMEYLLMQYGKHIRPNLFIKRRPHEAMLTFIHKYFVISINLLDDVNRRHTLWIMIVCCCRHFHVLMQEENVCHLQYQQALALKQYIFSKKPAAWWIEQPLSIKRCCVFLCNWLRQTIKYCRHGSVSVKS